jgi:DNA-binding response OmpR family regulator
MRILVVEDEHKIANSIKRGLEIESFAVDIAYEGETGLDLASTENYDAIILDLLLPNIGGLEICKKLRAANIHTPVLMLTAKGEIDDKVAGFNAGADDYLTKPFAFAELLARVRALTRRPKDALGTTLIFSDLSLNTVTFEVKRSGVSLSLSRKEYALLEYFLRHPNTILTKEQIIGNVWNYESDVLPNTVEVYVGYLREKIDKPFKDRAPLIHTARGFGYKFGEKS